MVFISPVLTPGKAPEQKVRLQQPVIWMILGIVCLALYWYWSSTGSPFFRWLSLDGFAL